MFSPEPPMKILLSGLQPDFDVEVLRERMSHFGTVVDIQAVRDGDAQQPWAIVEMALGVAEATEVARRIDGIYYIDRFIRAHVMSHG
jgi:putative N-acetylmannosamine-6-phosphate epimerase